MLFRKGRPEPEPPAREIAVVGAFRSGTNFLKTVLETNYLCRVVFHAYGWKHGFVPVISPQSAVRPVEMDGVFVTKDPFAFLVSLHAYHVAVGRNLAAPTEWDAFLRSPLTIFVQVRGEGPEYRFSTPVEYWNALNWNLLSVARRRPRFLHCRYESMLTDPEGVLQRLAARLGLVASGEPIRLPTGRVRRMSDRPEDAGGYETAEAFDAAHYLGRAYLSQFSADDRAHVEARLDAELMTALGYGLESQGNAE